MSITVRDCLKLPSFSQARVVAGTAGLSRSVNSVTVLEYADISVISADLFINHEMCITAFSSIKNDPEAQCAILRRMRDVGIVAVVLYYIGIFIPSLDERLIVTANEIGLPLICMPYNRFDFRYGEVINDVMLAIYRDQEKETRFVPELLDNISHMQEGRRTIRNILQMLSDRLHCSLLLVDQSGTLRGESHWPLATDWNDQILLDLLQHDSARVSGMHQTKMPLGQSTVYVTYTTVSAERIPFLHLLAFDEQQVLTENQVTQAAELIALFLNICNYTFEETTPDMLVRAIIRDEPLRMREIAAQHNIDTSQIQTMWVLHEKMSDEASAAKQSMAHYVPVARQFFQEQKKWALVDSYQNSVIILFKAATFSELDSGLADTFLAALGMPDSMLSLISFSGLLTTKDAREDYLLLQKCFDTVQLLLPCKSIFDMHDLHFAESCMQILEMGEPTLSRWLYPLRVLRESGNYEVLIQTLSVFLLDAGSNLQKTADIMFLHKNTIKYRMGRIREIFGCNFLQMPLAAALYAAVALQRLLDS